MTDIIVDLDGTVANLDHRLPYVKSKPKNWKAFNAGISNDKPIHEVINVVNLLERNNTIIFCSGRSEDTREATEDWIYKHIINYSWNQALRLYMRPSGDYRSDDVIKLELLERIRADGYNPTIAFDDRPRVVKAWRSVGIYVFDCNQSGVDF